MIQNYVIETVNGFVRWARITQIGDVIEVKKVEYTDNLQEAKIYTEEDYKEDVEAWEHYFGSKEGVDFKYIPVEFRLI